MPRVPLERGCRKSVVPALTDIYAFGHLLETFAYPEHEVPGKRWSKLPMDGNTRKVTKPSSARDCDIYDAYLQIPLRILFVRCYHLVWHLRLRLGFCESASCRGTLIFHAGHPSASNRTSACSANPNCDPCH